MADMFQTLKDSFADPDDQEAKKRRLEMALGNEQSVSAPVPSSASLNNAQESKQRMLQQFQQDQQGKQQVPEITALANQGRAPASAGDQVFDEDEATSLGINPQTLLKYTPEQRAMIIQKVKALKRMGGA